ncbi:uncharacterized protein KIAA1143 homolog [Centruroides vittatus]|uniref:uncharacterized protein KIAA1143 homolog n=1 Tax=Centruroides vittatus TaxID=120091 RepID=UPI00350FA6FA
MFSQKEQLPVDHESHDDIDEEKPVIVVLKPGDLSEEQVKEYQVNKQSVDTDEKILFRKPEKRTINENNQLDCSTKKIKESKPDKKSVDKSKQVKNSSLLSFDDGDDDDDEGE